MVIEARSTVQPFTENVKFPRAEGYGARIGDLWVRLAAGPNRPMRYFTKDSLAERQSSGGEASDDQPR